MANALTDSKSLSPEMLQIICAVVFRGYELFPSHVPANSEDH